MPRTPLQALIFDVDGTLADTEHAHLAAFNAAFAAEGLPWHWDEDLYTRLLDISGGKERLVHYWRQLEPDLKDIGHAGLLDTVERVHATKTAVYEEAVRKGAVSLRPGVLALVEEARRQGVTLAIATTTSPVNVLALLRAAIGPEGPEHFQVIEDASTAPLKKPHPQVYLQTLKRLALQPQDCLAIEDSSNGLAAAVAAGLNTVVTVNRFTAHHNFSDALRRLPSLSGVTLGQLRAWRDASLQQGSAMTPSALQKGPA